MFWFGCRSRENPSQESWFDAFLVLAPEVGKISPRSPDFMIFWPSLQKSRKSLPGIFIAFFLALFQKSTKSVQEVQIWWCPGSVTEVDKKQFHESWFMSVWRWPQKSTQSSPDISIWRIFGFGYRSQRPLYQQPQFVFKGDVPLITKWKSPFNVPGRAMGRPKSH